MKLVKCFLIVLPEENNTVVLIPREHIKNYKIIEQMELKKFFVAEGEFDPSQGSTKALPASHRLDDADIRCISHNNSVCYVLVDNESRLVDFRDNKSVLIYLRNPSERLVN